MRMVRKLKRLAGFVLGALIRTRRRLDPRPRLVGYWLRRPALNGTLANLLERHPDWTPQPLANLLFALLKRLRNIEDPEGANRGLPHRWRMIYGEIWAAIEGLVDFEAGPVVVNFGAGAANPLSLSLLFALAGASRSIAVEPDAIRTSTAILGLQETMLDVLARPSDYPGLRAERLVDGLHRALDMRALLACRSLEDITAGHSLSLLNRRGEGLDIAPGSVNLIFSRSVLEHIIPYDTLFPELVAMLAPGGVMVHEIDLSAHHPTDPFHFYYIPDWTSRDTNHGLNRLRASDYRRLFEGLGCDVRALQADKEEPEAIDRARLVPELRGRSEDDLLTSRLYLLVRKAKEA